MRKTYKLSQWPEKPHMNCGLNDFKPWNPSQQTKILIHNQSRIIKLWTAYIFSSSFGIFLATWRTVWDYGAQLRCNFRLRNYTKNLYWDINTCLWRTSAVLSKLWIQILKYQQWRTYTETLTLVFVVVKFNFSSYWGFS